MCVFKLNNTFIIKETYLCRLILLLSCICKRERERERERDRQTDRNKQINICAYEAGRQQGGNSRTFVITHYCKRTHSIF